MTVAEPRVMVPPCAVVSPILAAGWPPIMTVVDPRIMLSGGPVHVAMSPTRAAGSPSMITVGQPGGNIGPPTCGTVPVTIGQTCISDTLAAGCPIIFLIYIDQTASQCQYSRRGHFGTCAAFGFKLGIGGDIDIGGTDCQISLGFRFDP